MIAIHRQARATLARYAAALALVAVAAWTARSLELTLRLTDPALILLTGVLVTAVIGGLGPSLLGSVGSFLVYNFFFVEPRHTFAVHKAQDLVSLLVFLVVAVLTSQLMARARTQAELAGRREERMAALYSFGRQIAAAEGIDTLLPIIVGHIGGLFEARVVLLIPREGRLVVGAAYPPGTRLPERERQIAERTAAQSTAVDSAPSDGQVGAWLHVSLGTTRGGPAVLCLELPPDQISLDRDQLDLLDALSQQAAIAIERCRIDVVLSEKAKTEQVIEASEDGIFVLDGEGRVAHANAIACTIFGVDRMQAIGQPFDALASEQPHYLRVRQAVHEFRRDSDHPADRVEITVFLRGRDHHYVLRQTSVRVPDGLGPGVILALQDVTYLREQDTRRENLVATLSHELRTPLTSSRMAVELLRQRGGELSKQSRDLVDALHEDLLRLQDVSQQFLDLARTRAIAIGLQRRPFDLHELLARMVRLFSVQAKEKRITLETSGETPPRMTGDETKLSWALSNLISNAIRYTPEGGTVRIETLARKDRVMLSVADSGPGISPEEQERIFERYAQGSADGGAAGLGLAIVRDIVQAHGGHVLLRSAVGSGTRFTLDLPLE